MIRSSTARFADEIDLKVFGKPFSHVDNDLDLRPVVILQLELDPLPGNESEHDKAAPSPDTSFPILDTPNGSASRPTPPDVLGNLYTLKLRNLKPRPLEQKQKASKSRIKQFLSLSISVTMARGSRTLDGLTRKRYINLVLFASHDEQ